MALIKVPVMLREAPSPRKDGRHVGFPGRPNPPQIRRILEPDLLPRESVQKLVLAIAHFDEDSSIYHHYHYYIITINVIITFTGITNTFLSCFLG